MDGYSESSSELLIAIAVKAGNILHCGSWYHTFTVVATILRNVYIVFFLMKTFVLGKSACLDTLGH